MDVNYNRTLQFISSLPTEFSDYFLNIRKLLKEKIISTDYNHGLIATSSCYIYIII